MDNMLFSVPHRALAILLKRGLLEDYDLKSGGATSVLDGKEISIRLKPIAQNMPVFLAGKQGGRGLLSTPMQSHSLSEFLKRRCNELGIVASEGMRECSFYAWRNGAANRIYRNKGIEATRAIMGHSPGSNTFFDYHWTGAEQIDLFAVAAGEAEDQAAIESASEHMRCALWRVEQSYAKREAFIREYIDFVYQRRCPPRLVGPVEAVEVAPALQ